jgi:hypothetical protein
MKMRSKELFMTKAQVGFLVLLLLAVPKAFADGDTKAERQIAEIATKELINAVRDAGGIEGNPKIEVKAVVEREVRNAAASYCGIAFYVFLDGVGDPRLVYGSVGTGKDIEDARHDAYDEWRGMFVFTLASALGRSKDYLQMEGMQIYCSPLIVRGNVPVGENTADLPVRLVTPYVPIVKKTVLHGARQLKDIQTILLTVAIDSNGFTNGQWQFNGQIIPGLLANGRDSKLPTSGQYMLKQYYVFRGGKSE